MSYLTTLPYRALLIAAGFSECAESYKLPRARVIPPTVLLDAILPWAELELQSITARNLVCEDANVVDLSAEGFLKAVVWLKTV